MALDDAAVRDGLVDHERVRAVEQFPQGRGDQDRVDAFAFLRPGLGPGDGRLLGGVPLLLGGPAPVHGGRVEVLGPPGQLAQGVGDAALQVPVREEHLVDHVRALRYLVDDDDRRLRGAAARRVEGDAAVDQEDQVRLVHPRTDVAAGVQRMGAREVAADRRVRLDDRDVPRLGEGDQCLEAAGLAAGRLGDDHRVLGLADQLGDGIDLFGRAVRGAGGRDRLGLPAVPVLQQDLQGDVEVRGPRRCPPGQLRGPGDHRGQGVDAGGLGGPLGERPGDTVRASHDGEVAVPLAARVLARAVAVGAGLRGGDHHGDAGEQRPVDRRRALEQSGRRVQQDPLRAAGDQAVAGRHADRDGLVGEVEVGGGRVAVAVTPGQGLPHRGPFGPRRAEEVVGADGVEGGYEGFPAVTTARARGVRAVRHRQGALSPRPASPGPH